MPKWDDDEDVVPVSEPAKPVVPQLEAAPQAPVVESRADEATKDAPSERTRVTETFAAPAQPRPESRRAEDDSSRGIVEDAASYVRREEFGNFATRIGILGGKQVGKSYLFQALVHTLIQSASTARGGGSGVLSRYMRGKPPEIWHSLAMGGDTPALINTGVFGEEYRRWRRLPQTGRQEQRWYKLRMTFGVGLSGRKHWILDVDFLDGSGELLEIGLALPAMKKVWERAFGQATIMVFCLPLWVLFAERREMTQDDVIERERILSRFGDLVNTYKNVRDTSLKVQSFLALTMADDRRGSLQALRKRWIEPCTGDRRRLYLEKLGAPQGVPRYLASAREVSNYLYKEIRYSDDTRVREIPGIITFEDPPWLVPVSAIDGDELARTEAARKAGGAVEIYGEPRPAHVELPLLAAMCDCQNALM